MKVSRTDVQHIAQLSRLALSEEEIALYSGQLNTILEYVEQLSSLDTAEIPPTSHVLPLQNVMREDFPAPPLPRDEALKNAPDHTGKFYRVPRIIE